ncbi:amidohydrolase [Candidatus Entotheonella serta]|nr:amidohydrolase [Candidatus Entotheonella serta]
MDAKTGVQEQIDTIERELLEMSHRIHAHPELGYEEEKACAWLSESLHKAGFSVETGICDLPTAFVARAGNGPLHLAICCEYDCLPSIGHACGHNVIAAMSLGAGIAAAKVADDVGLTISVIGTPAEEAGDAGGKILLLERGAFDGIYAGKESHASAHPELGINAADALTVAQTAIGLLRQHIRPTDRIHGIITKGGDAPNVIPAHTSAKYIVRGRTLAELEELRPKVLRCFEAGAHATGATLEITGGDKPYAEMEYDLDLTAIYRRNAEALGRSFPDPADEKTSGSTDMGNVSLTIPSIHPMIGIDSLPAVNHQPEFTAHCITPAADKAVRDGALTMAWSAVDIAGDDTLRQRLLSRV